MARTRPCSPRENLPGAVAGAPWGVAVPDVVALLAHVVELRPTAAASARSRADVVIAVDGATMRWDAAAATAAPGGDPHARFTSAGLAALVLGACGVDDLVAAGAASVPDPRGAVTLARALPPGTCDLWPVA